MVETEISRQATVALVVEGVRRDALLGVYGCKKWLSETEVANQYGVSRSSVRSAFQILERDGLIELQPNGRKLLRSVDQKYIDDLCLTRSILEQEAVKLIMCQESCDFSNLLQLIGQFHMYQQLSHGKKRQRELTLINEKFHEELFILAKNSALLQCRHTIAPMISVIVEINTTLNPEENEHKYYESHKKIVEMLMERDEGIVEYIRYHSMDATRKDILRALQDADKNILQQQLHHSIGSEKIT